MTEQSENKPPQNMSPENLLEILNSTLGGFNLAMGLYFTEASLSRLVARVPVTETLYQPYGLVHGGVYAAMIDRMDQNIGKVMAKLRELGKADNTLVLFLADNGGCGETIHKTDNPPGVMEGYHTVDAPWANASNTPFRKYKSTDYEGGACTPLIAYWPKRITKGGRITRQLGHIIDIVPTCLAVAGVETPKTFGGKPVLPPEGVSLAPLLADDGKDLPTREPIFCSYGGYRAMWQGKWKIIARGKTPWELYDMSADRTELDDLAGKHPDRVQEMSAAYDAWRKRCKDDDQRTAPKRMGAKGRR